MHIPKESNPQLPFNNQTQVDLLKEKKENQELWSKKPVNTIESPQKPVNTIESPQKPVNTIEEPQLISSEMACTHSCMGSGGSCCQCCDVRPVKSEYTRHVVGFGNLNIGLREDAYCETCKSRCDGEREMLVIRKFNAIISTVCSDDKKKFLGLFGLTVCCEIKDAIRQLIEIHNLLYTYSVDLSLSNDTPDMPQETEHSP
jgi:hypothetical protein